MTLQTWKCLVCDNCTNAIDYLIGSNESVNRQARDSGVIVKGNKHFCDDDCYENYKRNNSKINKIVKEYTKVKK